MSEFSIEKIPLQGYSGVNLPNRFYRQRGEAHILAVILPGKAYTPDMPLLFYAASLLRQRGADVLQLLVDYSSDEFSALDGMERLRWLSADASAAVEAGWALRPYDRLVVVGKSLGTLAIAQLIEDGLPSSTLTIWITPLLQFPQLVAAASSYSGPALYIDSRNDPTHRADALDQILVSSGAESLVLEGADHFLEVPGDIFRSLEILTDVVREIDDFLGHYLD